MNKHRLFILVVVVLFSLGLVGGALAAAESMQRITVLDSQIDLSLTVPLREQVFPARITAPEASVPVASPQDQIQPTRQDELLPPEVLALMHSAENQSMVIALPANIPTHDRSAASSPAFPDFSTESGAQAVASQRTAQGYTPMTPPLPSGSEDLVICLESQRVWGIVSAGETVTVTVNGTQMGADQADENGFFWTTLYDSDGNLPNLAAGDQVDIYSNGALLASADLRDITGEVDVVNDEIDGSIGGSTGFPLGVTAYVAGGSSGEPSMLSYSQTVNTVGSGDFTLDFSGIWDIIADDTFEVAYAEGNVEVHQHIQATRIVVNPPPFRSVNGWSTGVVTVTVYSTPVDIRDYFSTTVSGRYELGLNMETGDTVYVELSDGTVMSRTVDALAFDVDTANDRITGNTTASANIRTLVGNNLTPLGAHVVQSGTVAAASGAFTVEFSGSANIIPGNWNGVHLIDDDGDELSLWRPSASVDVNQTWNEVSGRGPAMVGPDSDGRPVTLTLASTTTEYYANLDFWGWYNFNQDEHGLPDIGPGEIVTVSVQGYPWQGVVAVQTMTVESDPINERFTGTVETPSDRVELAGSYYLSEFYPAAGEFATVVTANSPFTASPPGFDVNGDLRYDVRHRTANEYAELISRGSDGVGAGIGFNGIGGILNPPGVAYTLTISDSDDNLKKEFTGNSNEPDGNLWVNLNEFNLNLEPGDHLQTESAAGYSHTAIIPDLWIDGDLDGDFVFGHGPANVNLLVSLAGDQYQGFVSTDSDGNFKVALNQLQRANGDGDLQWGMDLNVVYYDEKNTWLHNHYNFPNITAYYDQESSSSVFGHDAIPGNPIYVTVTHPVDGDIFTGMTEVGTGWEEPNGYLLEFPNNTLPHGNTVTVDFGDGYVDFVEVVTITGNVDPYTDIVTGTAPAGSYLSSFIEYPWGDDHHRDEIEVDANGVYTINYGTDGVDIEYGNRFHIRYQAPHGHLVEYVFWLPAPEVGVWKFNPGGIATPGGKYVYSIVWWNDGNGVATDVLLTDTLPVSTTYAGDTSGITPEIGANGVITWDMGDLPAWRENGTEHWGVFAVTLDVSDTVLTGTESLTENCAGISTTAPGDYNPDTDQRSSCSGKVDVWEDDVNISVEKWVDPGDPTPGQEYEYTIQWCGTSGSNFGPVWLTDTLPISSTLVDWWTDWPWNLWTELIATGDQLALYAPGLPGNYCQNIYLRLLLDPAVPLNALLENTVVVTTPLDRDSYDNEYRNTDARVDTPRYDLRVEKYFNRGVLVPGNWIEYGIYYRNDGNITTTVQITDTMPDGSEFNYAQWDGGDQPNADEPLPEPTINGNQVIWDLGSVEVGGQRWFHVSVSITDTLSPLDVITNCATISPDGDEDTPDNNTSCVETEIYASRPNLRITKWHEWRDDNNRLEYSILFENIGDETVSNVWITDTIPDNTTWTGWWDMEFEWERLSDDPDNLGDLRWNFSELYPGDSGWLYFDVNLDDASIRPRWYTNTVDIDIPGDDPTPGDNSYEDVVVLGEVEWVDLDIHRTRIWGNAPQGPITITSQNTETVLGWSGDFDVDFGDGFEPGEVITVAAANGLQPVVIHIPDPFVASASSITDTVWGQIDHLNHENVNIDLWDFPGRDVQTDGGGNFSAVYPDVPRGGKGDVNYYSMIDYAQVGFHYRFQTPDLLITVDYNHEWVAGDYEAGHTIWLTVTESDKATEKGTAQVSSGYDDDWNCYDCFVADWDNWSPGPGIDIQPGDWVYALINSEIQTTTVRVGAINGEVNANTDVVSGTIAAPWLLPALVEVSCEIHEQDGPSIQIPDVDPDGGEFYCNFSGMWDIQPGQNIAVNYTEPDGDRVQAHPANPAPRVAIEKWTESNPGEGGNFTFFLRYMNQGDANAENVIITDTLLGNMSYLGDTSGLTQIDSSNSFVVWDAGTLPPMDDWIEFQVFVTITGSTDEWITNTAEIATSNPFNQSGWDETHTEWSGQIQSSAADMSIGKNPWTGDPAPGQQFVWAVNACNDGSTDSSIVVVTDSLPISSTLLTWWGQHPGWSEDYEDADIAVFSRPTLQAWRCSEIYLLFEVDPLATPGTWISNTATIYTSNDIPDDNWSNTSWVQVNNTHTNLQIDKWFNWGQLVPGGQINYGIAVDVPGNVPVDDITITDTLPVSTTIVGLWAYDRDWNLMGDVSYSEDGDQIIWAVDTLTNGFRANFELLLSIDGNAPVGTILLNQAEVSPKPDEDRYDDNYASWTEEIFNHGPNLRVRKDGNWHDWGEETRRISYWLSIENIGDQVVEPVMITDTYDSKMNLETGLGMGFWRWWNWGDTGEYITITLESLYGGESVGANFDVMTDTWPLDFGLIFTNTAEITIDPEDTNPDDNYAEKILTTGPDLFVEKELVAGNLLPGELITFSLTFGNKAGVGYWSMQGDAWMTDTIPAELEFITATQHWCGVADEWCVVEPTTIMGNDYGWQLWPQGAGEWNEIYLTARITDTSEGGDLFTNWVEIASTEPISDTEAYYNNNVNSYGIVIALPKFTVSKSYESSHVVGTVVTYTVMVTNNGAVTGTNAILSDTLPTGLTYGGGGDTWNGTDVTWNILSIAPNGGTATRTFTATITGSGTVTNDTYRVISSDQGVISDLGPSVSFESCTPLTSVDFTFLPANPFIGEEVSFSATFLPVNATTPITYTWDFDDGTVLSNSTATVNHTFDEAGTFTVKVTVANICTPGGINLTKPVVINLYQLFLPLIIR
jgi:uncharacterized repeat protein (TIGR01451 family)